MRVLVIDKNNLNTAMCLMCLYTYDYFTILYDTILLQNCKILFSVFREKNPFFLLNNSKNQTEINLISWQGKKRNYDYKLLPITV